MRPVVVSGKSAFITSQFLRIVEGGDGRIHVVWGLNVRHRSAGFPEVLEHAHSDDGRCWSEAVRIAGPTTLTQSPVVRADDGGGLHLVYWHNERFLEPPSYYMYLYWDGFGWTDPEPLFGLDEAARWFGMDRDDEGVLHFLFSSADEGGDLYHARGRP